MTKSSFLSIYLKPGEELQVRQYVKEKGITISDFCRDSISEGLVRQMNDSKGKAD